MASTAKRLRPENLTAALASVVLFALLCAVVAYWVLQWLAPQSPVAPNASSTPALPADPMAATQLFGLDKGPGPVAARVTNIQVIGIAASGRSSAAILSVDGKPARAFAIGEKVSEGTTLSMVRAEGVEIERDGTKIQLAAPPRPDLAILTSGVGKTRGADTQAAAQTPVPTQPMQPGVPAQPAAPAGAVAPGGAVPGGASPPGAALQALPGRPAAMPPNPPTMSQPAITKP